MREKKIIIYLLITIVILLLVDIFARPRHKNNIERTKPAVKGTKIETPMPQLSRKPDEIKLLIESDKLAQRTITRMFYNQSSRLSDGGTIVFDPYKDPDYMDLMGQLNKHYKKGGKGWIYNIFGYDAGVPIVYIFEHYEDWQKMKQNR